MQIIQFRVNDDYLQLILSILQNLKKGIIEDLSIIKNSSKDIKENNTQNDDDIDIFLKTAGIISSQNIDPMEWQKNIRLEWDR